MITFLLGQTIRVSTAPVFTSTAGVPFTPTSGSLTYTAPNGAMSVYTLAQLTLVAVGSYTHLFTPPQYGVWEAEIVGVDASGNSAVSRSTFWVSG